jgi:tetratricopeptide (TPR) repeat protein
MRRTVAVLSFAFLASCSAAPGPQPVNPSTGQQTPARAPGSAPGAMPDSPEARNNAPTQPLDDKVAQLQAAYDKNPNDAAAKKQLADALYQNANYYMYNSSLGPKEKYPKALALYRQTLKLDPSNSGAQEAVGMIESIYRQMGREVPKA